MKLKPIRVTFCGLQLSLPGINGGDGGDACFAMWNILEPLGEHPVGSTLSTATLLRYNRFPEMQFSLRLQERMNREREKQMQGKD